MYFSGVQGVDSDVEITSETADLSKMKIARIKTKFSHHDERVHVLYKSPFWWSQLYLLGTGEVHVANINDDDVIETIDTIGIDNFLEQNEVSCQRNWLPLRMQIIFFFHSFIRNDGKNHPAKGSVFLA